MILSPQQDAALVKVNEWLKTGTHKQQVFRLFGYAGSGKSSIARKLVDDVGGSVYFAAYTGKAALVMRQKGCPNATTIHSLAYTPTGNDAKAYEDIKAAIAQFEEHLLKQGSTPEEVQSNKRVLELKVMLANEHMRAKRPRFRLNTESVLKEADLLVIDEVSMVDVPTGEDLESFGCPILVLGDPAQLQPVKGTGYFTLSNPDVMLTEIHRQAADNPIIRLATLARERKPLPLGQYGDSRVIRKSELREHPEYAQGAGIVLCGTHRTRIPGNARMRELAGRTGKLPQIGDKLVCSRNNKEIGLLNGGLWEVLEVHAIGEETMTVSLRSLDIPQTLHCIDIDAMYFNSDGKEEMPFWETGVARFDYGYLLTVHRSQGSQWDDVLTIDESEVFRQDRYCHLYTAITRAAERTTVAV